METGLTRWRDRWTAAGFPAIPLARGGKVALCEAWPYRPPSEQWAEVGGGERDNIGVLTGGPLGAAVIDGDDAGAVASITAALGGLGIDAGALPQVETATPDHRHFWIRVKDPPTGAFCNLSPDIGPGELRFGGGAYVVAPCSEVDGRRYRFTKGSPEAVAGLRPIRWADLAGALLAPTVTPTPATLGELKAPPLRLVWRPMPERAQYLLTVAGTASKGRPMAGYGSRSEAEAAAVALLILAGWVIDDIEKAFRQYKPGHYADHAKPDYYLTKTYRNVLSFLAASPTRAAIVEQYHKAAAAPWPGRGGPLERAVYLALLAICWQWDRWTVGASERCLAEHAATNRQTAHAALGRLRDAGLIRQAEPWEWDPQQRRGLATVWQVERMHTNMPQVTVRGVGAVNGATLRGFPEVWNKDRLGRCAGLVWERLREAEPLRVVDFARLTGRHRNSVRQALGVLEAHGLARLVRDGWVRGDVGMVELVRALGADRLARLRWERHNVERQAWCGLMAEMHGDGDRDDVAGRVAAFQAEIEAQAVDLVGRLRVDGPAGDDPPPRPPHWVEVGR